MAFAHRLTGPGTVYVKWGSESWRRGLEKGDAAVSRYQFDTHAEAEAFRFALGEHDGYLESLEVNAQGEEL